jgi:hypothetical protein
LLTVRPAGVAAPSPSEELASRQMASLVADLAQRHDLSSWMPLLCWR